MQIDHLSLLFVAAWFIQMGAHEGAHAHAAYRCGDDTAALQGKCSFNPLVHVDWRDINSVLFAVVAPVVSALMGLVPMGMAWVPISPRQMRGWRRDVALVSLAGPAANLAVAAVCLPLHLGLVSLGYGPESLLRVLDDLVYAVYLTSLVYGLFNLLPIPPLDGSKILYYFLPPWGRGVMDQLQPYGMLILVAIFFVGPGSGLLSVPLGAAMALWGLVG